MTADLAAIHQAESRLACLHADIDLARRSLADLDGHRRALLAECLTLAVRVLPEPKLCVVCGRAAWPGYRGTLWRAVNPKTKRLAWACTEHEREWRRAR